MSLEEALYRAYLATALFGIIGFCIYFYAFINDYLDDKLTFKMSVVNHEAGISSADEKLWNLFLWTI